jgi:hypothetical protein
MTTTADVVRSGAGIPKLALQIILPIFRLF